MTDFLSHLLVATRYVGTLLLGHVWFNVKNLLKACNLKKNV